MPGEPAQPRPLRLALASARMRGVALRRLPVFLLAGLVLTAALVVASAAAPKSWDEMCVAVLSFRTPHANPWLLPMEVERAPGRRVYTFASERTLAVERRQLTDAVATYRDNLRAGWLTPEQRDAVEETIRRAEVMIDATRDVSTGPRVHAMYELTVAQEFRGAGGGPSFSAPRSVQVNGWPWPAAWSMRNPSALAAGLKQPGAWTISNDRLIPLRPMWRGLIADTLVLGGGAWIVVTALGLARGWWRARRGRCPSCGYDVKRDFASPCPECGAAAVGATGKVASPSG